MLEAALNSSQCTLSMRTDFRCYLIDLCSFIDQLNLVLSQVANPDTEPCPSLIESEGSVDIVEESVELAANLLPVDDKNIASATRQSIKSILRQSSTAQNQEFRSCWSSTERAR